MILLQQNLNHCEAAQDLLDQAVREIGVDVAIVQEQYRNRENTIWAADISGRAAIWACGQQAFQSSCWKDSGFVRVKINGIHMYSCYARPSATLGEYKIFLDRLVNDARDRHPVFIAGDFNAWATEWGSRESNDRGVALLEAFATLQLVLLNTGNKPTFQRGNATSIVDLTWVSSSMFSKGISWEVSERYTHSDHQAIIIELIGVKSQKSQPKYSCQGWKTNNFDKSMFLYMLENKRVFGNAENKVSQLMNIIKDACDAAMPRRIVNNRRKAIYWWNDEIVDLRRKCFRARRKYQRSRIRGNEDLRQAYCNARLELKTTIKLRKQQCFTELCKEVDCEPWGRPYKTVMKKVKGGHSNSPTCPSMMHNIVSSLFPQQDYNPNNELVEINEEEDRSPVTIDEVVEATSKVGNNKAPGPDNIPNFALKLAVHTIPELFADTFNSCLSEGVFPKRWKKQRLVLLPKGKKAPEDPASYRPICMLDTVGKIFESDFGSIEKGDSKLR